MNKQKFELALQKLEIKYKPVHSDAEKQQLKRESKARQRTIKEVAKSAKGAANTQALQDSYECIRAERKAHDDAVQAFKSAMASHISVEVAKMLDASSKRCKAFTATANAKIAQNVAAYTEALAREPRLLELELQDAPQGARHAEAQQVIAYMRGQVEFSDGYHEAQEDLPDDVDAIIDRFISQINRTTTDGSI